jgi:23S rRNA maturation-related 3'-5' exoribonuclease YhaM
VAEELTKKDIKMAEELTKRRGKIVYDENPFLKGLVVKTRTKKYSNTSGEKMMLVSKETGEIKPAGFWTAKKVDEEQFIKLFVNGVKAFAELSNAGVKVFEYVYKAMQESINKDKIYLSFNSESIEISERTWFRGINELVEKGFIAAEKRVNWYFINPDFMFNGDRLVFAQEFVKVKNTASNKEDTKTIDMFNDEGEENGK